MQGTIAMETNSPSKTLSNSMFERVERYFDHSTSKTVILIEKIEKIICDK